MWREEFFLTIMNIVINDNDNFGNNIDDHHITGGPGLEGGRRRGGRRHLRGARALCQKSLKSTSTGYEDIYCSLFKIFSISFHNKQAQPFLWSCFDLKCIL